MRTSEELIAELEQEASKHDGGVMLVVGFEDTSIMIKPEQEDRLKLLNDAVEAGGEPVGLIALHRVNVGSGSQEVNFITRVYPEYEGEEREQMRQFLTALSKDCAKSLVKTFGGKMGKN